MVGGLGALAVVAVDPAGPQARRQLGADQHEVDPQPEALVEVARPVVPPGVLDLVGMQCAVGVDEAVVEDPLQAPALLRGHVGGAGERGGIVDVAIGRGDVHVAGHDQRRAAHRAHALRHGVQEGELARELRVVGGPAVGHVDAGQADPLDGRLTPARLLGHRIAGQPEQRVLEREPLAGQQRDAGPPAAGLVHGAVAGAGELGHRERVGRALGLLQAGDIGAVLRQQLQDPRQARAQRVDVPGDDAHGAGVES